MQDRGHHSPEDTRSEADAPGAGVAPGSDPLADEEVGISPAEREEIKGQIAGLTRRGGPGDQAGAPALEAGRSGARLPLIVDAGALLVLAVGAVLLFLYFDSKQESLVSDTTRILSAEARVVRAVREEAAARLTDKDREIDEIETRLDEVSRERARILEDLEARVSRREQELEQEMGSELEALRGELRRRGTAERDIEAELAALQASKQRELDSALAAFRDEARREVEDREREAALLNNRLAASLEAARADRAALEAQHLEESRRLEGARTAVEERLRAAEESRQREQLVRDQIAASYEAVRRDVDAGRYAAAVSSLDALEAYLGTDLVAAVPSFARYRSIEVYLIRSLRDLIDRRIADRSEATLALAEAGRLLRSVADSYGRAEALLAGGDPAGASRLYLAAIERIPEVARSHARLEAMRAAREREAVDAALRSGRAGGPAAALEVYREAIVTLGDTGARLYGGILDASTAEYRASQEARERRWAALRAVLESLEASPASGQKRAQELDYEETLALVESKIRTMKVLLSDGVREREPDLAAGLERYLEALGRSKLEQGRVEGRRETAVELSRAFAALRGAAAQAQASSEAGGPALPEEIVDGLREILELAFE